ncbi:MAG: hypothetical protein ABI651_13780, partial [Verrucomicrobiota bacterium]
MLHSNGEAGGRQTAGVGNIDRERRDSARRSNLAGRVDDLDARFRKEPAQRKIPRLSPGPESRLWELDSSAKTNNAIKVRDGVIKDILSDNRHGKRLAEGLWRSDVIPLKMI